MLRNFGLTLFACCLAHAASAQQLVAAPESRQELAKTVRAISAANNCDAMMELFYLEGVDDARRAAFANSIVNYVCSSFGRPITSIAFQQIPAKDLRPAPKFNDQPSEYTLTPEGAMVMDYGMSGGGQTTSLSLLYGKHNDKYYLITTRAPSK